MLERFNDLVKDDSFRVYLKWGYNAEDFDYKILLCIAAHGGTYTGTLTGMCKWFGISKSSKFNNSTKEALDRLAGMNYLKYSLQGYTYKIELINDEYDDYLNVRYVWLDEIRKYNKDENGNNIDKKLSISWWKVVRIFVYLFSLEGNEGQLTFMAEKVNMKPATFRMGMKFLEQVKMTDIEFSCQKDVKRIVCYRNCFTFYTCVGMKIQKSINVFSYV